MNPYRSSISILPHLIALLAALLSIAGGIVAATGSSRAIILVVGGIAGFGLLALRQELLMQLMFGFTLLVTGSVAYFSQIEVINWIPYLIGALLYLKFLSLAVVDKTRYRLLVAPVALLFLFWFVALTSVAINGIGMGTAIVAAKDYVMVWGALLIMAFTFRDHKTFEQIWKLIILAAVLQVPICAYQYIVVGGRLAAVGKQGWDAVSGSMGGSEQGGGSAAAAFLVVVSVVMMLSLLRRVGLQAGQVLTVCVAALITLALTEVKAVLLIFLPLGLLLVYRGWITSRPVKFVGLAFSILMVIAALMLAHNQLHYQRVSADQSKSIAENLQSALALETQASAAGMRAHDMGRTALIAFWLKERPRFSWHATLLGHGPASTKVGRFSAGSVVHMFPGYRLQKTGVSILLWEFGLFGTAVFFAMLLLGAMKSFSLARSDLSILSPRHRAMLDAGGIILLLFCASIFYARFALDMPPMVLILILCLSQAAFFARHMRVHARHV
jgi:hypothetical protein